MSKYEKLIKEIVITSHTHPTAEEIFLIAKSRNSKISLATVYNNLKKLVESGEIKKISTDEGKDRYDDTEPHAHLVCTRCGEITDYYYEDNGDEITNLVNSNPNVVSIDLKIDYVCPKCRDKEKELK